MRPRVFSYQIISSVDLIPSATSNISAVWPDTGRQGCRSIEREESVLGLGVCLCVDWDPCCEEEARLEVFAATAPERRHLEVG